MLERRPPEPSHVKRPRRARGALPSSELITKEFLTLLPAIVHDLLPEDLSDFKVRGPVFSLVGFYYAEDPRVHYEVWIQRRTSRLEIGLHFEAEPEVNSRWLQYFSTRAPEILARLGPSVEGEQWTQRWTRLHESLPLAPLTPGYAEQVARRIADFIHVLEPMRREHEEP